MTNYQDFSNKTNFALLTDTCFTWDATALYRDLSCTALPISDEALVEYEVVETWDYSERDKCVNFIPSIQIEFWNVATETARRPIFTEAMINAGTIIDNVFVMNTDQYQLIIVSKYDKNGKVINAAE